MVKVCFEIGNLQLNFMNDFYKILLLFSILFQRSGLQSEDKMFEIQEFCLQYQLFLVSLLHQILILLFQLIYLKGNLSHLLP